jgi:predicted NBD/HSP70 family sugar kinase
MYLGIDIGGTKTLVAVLDNKGVIVHSERFPTPKNYNEFLAELEKTISSFDQHEFVATGVGMPATLFDRKNGIGKEYGNLPWENVPIKADIEKICKTPVVVENDAKLAALSEAMLLKNKYDKVLYVTISTGIGIGLIADGVIDTSVGDGGGRTILLEHEGKPTPWEEFASGKAIYEKYGMKASDINDDETWKAVCKELARGFIHLIGILQPEVIVIGGGVGTYFDKYSKFLVEDIESYHIPLIKMPAFVEAQRPEEAVIYGCYDLAKHVHGNG